MSKFPSVAQLVRAELGFRPKSRQQAHKTEAGEENRLAGTSPGFKSRLLKTGEKPALSLTLESSGCFPR